MKKNSIFVHTSYVGTSGFNSHAQNLFRRLSKYNDIKIRNFTVGKTWSGISENPHLNEPNLDGYDHSMLAIQTCISDDKLVDYPINNNIIDSYDVNLILNETNHHYFYNNYIGPKIAYNVWESTEQPQDFFDKLLEFDELWVPTKWQKECTIKQGYPKDKIKVVPEGVDIKLFYPENISLKRPKIFKFFLAGRWDYRKSTKEIIETFLHTFDNIDDVELLVSIDNKWADQTDEYKSTEERLAAYNLLDDKIKVLHFPDQKRYIDLIKNSNCFLSCARSEGWNLPLIEAMASGTPSIYSECSGQLEYAKGLGIPVRIKGEVPTNNNSYSKFSMGNVPGNYYEPDFDHLKERMLDVYTNYSKFKKSALADSERIRNKFSWDNVAKICNNHLNNFMEKMKKDTNEIKITFNNGPRVEIIGDNNKTYNVKFIDDSNDEIVHSGIISNNMWIKCSREWFTKWRIEINGEVYHKFNLDNKKVIIRLDSKSVGDTIAWIPYILQFQKKHNCKLYASTFHNDWFKGHSDYKNIMFINPDESTDSYASYSIGWFKYNEKWDSEFKNPILPNTIPLQKTATSILGLSYKEIRPNLYFDKNNQQRNKKYVAISTKSTAALKEWDINKWRIVVKYLNELGYDVIEVSNEFIDLPGAINLDDTSWNSTFNIISNADFFIGLSSGLSWVAWALEKKVLLISNFSEIDHEFTSNSYRVYDHSVCNSCWNNRNFTFDAGDWNWCPIHKNTKQQHICHKAITHLDVISVLNNLINDIS